VPHPGWSLLVVNRWIHESGADLSPLIPPKGKYGSQTFVDCEQSFIIQNNHRHSDLQNDPSPTSETGIGLHSPNPLPGHASCLPDLLHNIDYANQKIVTNNKYFRNTTRIFLISEHQTITRVTTNFASGGFRI